VKKKFEAPPGGFGLPQSTHGSFCADDSDHPNLVVPLQIKPQPVQQEQKKPQVIQQEQKNPQVVSNHQKKPQTIRQRQQKPPTLLQEATRRAARQSMDAMSFTPSQPLDSVINIDNNTAASTNSPQTVCADADTGTQQDPAAVPNITALPPPIEQDSAVTSDVIADIETCRIGPNCTTVLDPEAPADIPITSSSPSTHQPYTYTRESQDCDSTYGSQSTQNSQDTQSSQDSNEDTHTSQSTQSSAPSNEDSQDSQDTHLTQDTIMNDTTSAIQIPTLPPAPRKKAVPKTPRQKATMSAPPRRSSRISVLAQTPPPSALGKRGRVTDVESKSKRAKK
jgi:hypothetical protein